MPNYASADHHLVEAVAWRPDEPAERVNAQILLSRGTSNSYLISTADGDVVINTGTPYQGARHRERFEALLGRPLSVRKVIFTQSHPDHMGGWHAFAGPGVETIAHRLYRDGRLDRTSLTEFFQPRFKRILGRLSKAPQHVNSVFAGTRDAEVDTFVDLDHRFSLGGVDFEIFSAPSGETTDGLIIWLPRERTVFTGNFMGALYRAMPHFYTLRGDRERSTRQFIRDIDRVIGLAPALLLTGHDSPIVGESPIKADLSLIRDAVAHVHEETLKGMNAQKDLFTLMRQIKLPEAIERQLAPGRGPVSWYVRSIWEEYAGWFRHESTTELYGVPHRAIWAELAQMAGGVVALTAKARAHMDAGRPLEALHFTDMVHAVEPNHRPSREVEIEALTDLLNRTGGKTYDELTWLEDQLDQARAIIG